MSELFREALRRYVGPDKPGLSPARRVEWEAARERARIHVASLGITEDDVERLSDEYRSEIRERVG
jgi:hypothetical protein